MNVPVQISLAPGQIILNKYEILRPLGAGQFGEVFHVLNRNLGHEAALKLVRVEDPVKHRAVIEAQAQYLCKHDHVVKVLTADVFDGAVLIEMEYIDGGSLASRLKNEFVPILDSIGYIKQVLFALEHAHNRGIVHRDVKPGNILISGSLAKLSDFGTVIHPQSGIKVIDQFYRPHASPEAALQNDFSAASDVFAAGMTLLRAVNNDARWDSLLNTQQWRQLVLNGTLAAQVGYSAYVPGKLKRIINKATNSDLSARYSSAAAFRQDLERLRPARRWARIDDNTWMCHMSGKDEVVQVRPGVRPSLTYTVAGRRRVKDCDEFRTEREARKRLEAIIASTTLA